MGADDRGEYLSECPYHVSILCSWTATQILTLQSLLVQRRIRRGKDREHQESHSVLGSNRLAQIHLERRSRLVCATSVTEAAIIQGQRRTQEDPTGRGESRNPGEADPPGKPYLGSIRECANPEEQQFQSICESCVSRKRLLLIDAQRNRGNSSESCFKAMVRSRVPMWIGICSRRVVSRTAMQENGTFTCSTNSLPLEAKAKRYGVCKPFPHRESA